MGGYLAIARTSLSYAQVISYSVSSPDFCCSTPWKAAHNGSAAWVPVIHTRNQMERPAFSLALPQLQMKWIHDEWTIQRSSHFLCVAFYPYLCLLNHKKDMFFNFCFRCFVQRSEGRAQRGRKMEEDLED